MSKIDRGDIIAQTMHLKHRRSYVNESDIAIALEGYTQEQVKTATKICIEFAKTYFSHFDCINNKWLVNAFFCRTVFLAKTKIYKRKNKGVSPEFNIESDLWNELSAVAAEDPPIPIKKSIRPVGVYVPDSSDDEDDSFRSVRINRPSNSISGYDMHSQDEIANAGFISVDNSTAIEEFELMDGFSELERKILEYSPVLKRSTLLRLGLSERQTKTIIFQIKAKSILKTRMDPMKSWSAFTKQNKGGAA